jgi:23S rRNA (pseudouridine1915-N3)-methyltransferase
MRGNKRNGENGMKFSEIEKERWDELSPYLDTCLLPVTGLTGGESPHEATEKLEQLRDVLDLVEIPFKGRVVTYPACHYLSEAERAGTFLAGFVDKLRDAGFVYIIIATANPALDMTLSGADLILQKDDNGEGLQPAFVSSQIRELWSGGSPL